MKDLVLRLLLLRNDIVTCPPQFEMSSESWQAAANEKIQTELMERQSHIATTRCISQETIATDSLESQRFKVAGLSRTLASLSPLGLCEYGSGVW